MNLNFLRLNNWTALAWQVKCKFIPLRIEIWEHLSKIVNAITWVKRFWYDTFAIYGLKWVYWIAISMLLKDNFGFKISSYDFIISLVMTLKTHKKGLL